MRLPFRERVVAQIIRFAGRTKSRCPSLSYLPGPPEVPDSRLAFYS